MCDIRNFGIVVWFCVSVVDGVDMTLSDSRVCECEGGACKVSFAVPPIGEDDIEILFRSFVFRDRIRSGRAYQWGNFAFWRDKGVPLMRVMGVEFGLRQISPMLEWWL